MTSSTLGDGAQAPSASKQELDQIYKKVMWRILPFIFLLWMLAWIDRLNIGFAKLQMQPELGFSETVYGIGAGIFKKVNTKAPNSAIGTEPNKITIGSRKLLYCAANTRKIIVIASIKAGRKVLPSRFS